MTVRLSSVTFVRPAQREELFGNILAPANSSGNWAAFVKILGKNLRDSRGSCTLNIKGYEKLAFSRFISKTVQDTAIVTMEVEQELVCDLSSGAICNADDQWRPRFSPVAN